MKGAYRFPSRNDAINWISEQEGATIEPISTYSRAEYYRCKDSIYVVRINKRCCEVHKKAVINGQYIMISRKSGHTCRKVNREDRPVTTIGLRWLDVYTSFFRVIVKTLASHGIQEDDAKDLAQEAFIRISGIEAENEKHFFNIWVKECFWIRWRMFRKGRESINGESVTDICCHQEKVEMPLSSMLDNERQRKITDLTQHGYSVNDISELMGVSPASVYSVLRRAKAILKKILV